MYDEVTTLALIMMGLTLSGCMPPSPAGAIEPLRFSALALYGIGRPVGSAKLSLAWDDGENEFNNAVALYEDEKWLQSARRFVVSEKMFQGGQANQGFYNEAFLGARCAAISNAMIAFAMARLSSKENLSEETTFARQRSTLLPDCHLNAAPEN